MTEKERFVQGVAQATAAMMEEFRFLGVPVDHPGLKDTPSRVGRAWWEMLEGYRMDPKDILSRAFPGENYDQMIVLRDVPFYSTCEHHLLPFSGVATVGYIPRGDAVVGLSKLARLVDAYSRRLQIQERMTVQIADALEENLNPLGLGVVVRATHDCMVCRGVKKPGAEMVTSVLRGAVIEDSAVRAEFMALSR